MITVTQSTDVCLDVRSEWKAGTKKSFLLISDVHFDNPKCRRKLFYKHMDEALERNAQVLSFGDFFCFMQGRYDPRSNKSDIRPEHNVKNYLDKVISDSAKKMEKYKDNILLLADGNHETSILNRLETDPTGRFANKLGVNRGGYQGFVRFKFEHEGGGQVKKFNLFYHHGKWGGIVTKGTLSTTRFAAIVPDADMVVSGHTHDKWYMEQPRYRLKQNGNMKVEPQYHIKCGTYKEEFAKSGGWAVERIVAPKSMGGWWLNFEFKGSTLIPSLVPAQ